MGNRNLFLTWAYSERGTSSRNRGCHENFAPVVNPLNRLWNGTVSDTSVGFSLHIGSLWNSMWRNLQKHSSLFHVLYPISLKSCWWYQQYIFCTRRYVILLINWELKSWWHIPISLLTAEINFVFQLCSICFPHLLWTYWLIVWSTSV